jgi:hypothetical protein
VKFRRALALLAVVALAGCGSGAAAGRHGPGRTVAGSTAGSPGIVSAGASPAGTATGSSHSIDNQPATRTGSTATGGAPGTAPGCARWPAGSASTILLITQASNGLQFCVHPGQDVQVFLSGTLSPVDGSEPPRLTGTGLVPAAPGSVPLLRSPAAVYAAVRAGRVVLTVVRQPCHSVQPAQTPTPAAGPDGTEGAGLPDVGSAGPGATGSVNAVETAWRGGAPVGAQCALEQALRVIVIVS